MAKSRKSYTGPTILPDLAALEQAALEAFGALVNPQGRALIGTIRAASYFATPDHGDPEGAILDEEAFLLGLLHYGLAQPPGPSTAYWVAQWITDEVGYDEAELADIFAKHERAAENARLIEAGAPVVLHNGMRIVLHTARKLTGETVEREVVDLRHLVLPLLYNPEEWGFLPRPPTPAQIAPLRQRIVDGIASAPEPGENVEAWKAMLGDRQAGPNAAGPEDEPEVGIISVEPGGTLAIDARELLKMREAFLARFPDFEDHGFDAGEGSYWIVERHYKQKLIDTTAKAIRSMFDPTSAPADIGTAVLGVLESKASNLLDWRELRRLKEVRQETPGLIEQALGGMIASTLPPAESVALCIEQIAEAYLRGQEENRPFAHLRTLPTTALALARPEEAIAVRYTTMHRAGIRLTGGSLFGNAPMSAHEYQVVLDIAHHIEKVMRDAWGWRPRDLWDVQGFLWVATESDKSPEPQVDDSTDRPGDASVQDRYRTQADDPAMVDALERGPFAAVLAARIGEIRKSERTDEPEGDRAFMVHLHGPWGSGKSSILNLLRQELERPKEGEASLVVMFNAWKQQRMRPPWWALMNAIYRRAMDRPRAWAERLGLWRRWWFWRWKAEVFPIALVGAIAVSVIFLILSGQAQDEVEVGVKIGVVAIAALASIYAYARRMIFGSQKAVQTYADLTTDPYRRIVDLFNRLVTEINPPLVVFIDDLDRCDSDYVVELLEGIQTLFRHAPVTYVVAADRKWICSSFEKKYGDFAGSIGEPCRPLGYLFLDKLFQISAEMPRLTREVQAGYLAALLREETAPTTGISPKLIAEAEERVSGISNEADLQQLIAEDEAQVVPAESPKQSLDRHRALRHAAALQITSAKAVAETEHRLQKLSHLLEPNPRSMKRLVNAVGMAQARGILEGRAASPETRARWAMLSLRWPILADFLAENPSAISRFAKTKNRKRITPADSAWPETVRSLFGNAVVADVVGAPGDDGALTHESLGELLA